jgi:hypothetical protein
MEHAPLYSVPVAIRVLGRFLANNRPARTVATVWAGLLTVLHSGTNNFHESGFEFHNNQRLNARNFFRPLNPDGTLRNKGKVVYNQLGGTCGGPILKDKLFFFTSYENNQPPTKGQILSARPRRPALRRRSFSPDKKS